MIRQIISVRRGLAALATAVCIALAAPAFSAETMMTPDEVLKDVEATFGGIPAFVKQIPEAALPGFWALEKGLELNDKTALDAKTKALISLAVASQIPCQYCIWADTATLKQMGASDQEIAEAVGMAGLTRLSSTMFNGLQVDFGQFKKDLTPPAN
jgi:AhpD family alkylhydroperoxidase